MGKPGRPSWMLLAAACACVACSNNTPTSAPAAVDSAATDSDFDADALPGEADDTADTGDTPDEVGGDPKLPPEPTIPAACTTLSALKASKDGVLDDETAPDTVRIQAAIDGCGAGKSVRLTTGGAKDAFLSGPLTMRAGVTLWIDVGATLFASRDPREYDVEAGTCGTDANDSSGGCKPLIAVSAANVGVMGDGMIDGRGGEPMIGGTATWWDVAQQAKVSGRKHSNPRIIDVKKASNFTLYKVNLRNSPKFHVVINSKGYIVWGVTIKTPSRATNSVGLALTPLYARNTDGIDPSGASDGVIAYNRISTGDDQIALKAGSTGPIKGLLIAHNHFGSGHGMSIGSETDSGVSDVHVYDLSIDGDVPDGGMGKSSRNGIRIKSDASRGGLVTGVTYEDVCIRGKNNPIVLDPRYTDSGGSLIPVYEKIVLRNIHVLAATKITPVVTLNGYDATHITGVTLDNVIIDGIASSDVIASFASVTLGPGDVNFTPSGSGVTTTNAIVAGSTPNPCTGKWVAF